MVLYFPDQSHADAASTAPKNTLPVHTFPLALNHHDASVQTIGKLIYMGGLKVTSPSPNFGGLSGLEVSADGTTLLGVTDRGYWWTVDVEYQDNRLHDLKNMVMSPLMDDNGKPVKGVRNDSEAVTAYSPTGYIVSFEGHHRLRYYQAARPGDLRSLFKGRSQKLTFIPATFEENIKPLPGNQGLEAVTALQDGRLLALSEGDSLTGAGEAAVKGWIIGWGQAKPLMYEVGDQFKPTDLATLPNGDVLVLERHFSISKGAAARLRRLSAWDLRAGATLKGELLAELSYPFNVDNMEGLAIRQDADGNILIYLLSDDNFNALQRTLLMMFRLDDSSDTPPQ